MTWNEEIFRTDEIRVERNVPVPMRDGTVLRADVYRPDSPNPYPVLLMRTPYNKEDAQTMNYAHPIWYARHGYVVIIQDTRGRGRSEGEFHPHRHEADDGYDTVEWAASLPGVLPSVGMYGFSYVGSVQWQAASARPPHLVCIAPGMTGSDVYQGMAYRNGAFAQACIQSWVLFVARDSALRQGKAELAQELAAALADIRRTYSHAPLSETPFIPKDIAPYYEEWLHHSTRDGYWRELSIKEKYGSIAVPALHLAGWYDIFVDGTIENFRGIREQGATDAARNHQYLIIEPWHHMPWSRYVGELDFGQEAENRIDRIQLEWFGRWLKADESKWRSVPAVQYFQMGENRWMESAEWPPEGSVATPLYLHSGSRANSINGDGSLNGERPGREEPDLYIYHPSIPVPAIGGRSGAVPELTPMGPKNQLPIEVRNDVLVYTSDVLKEELVLAGDIQAILYASTSAEDTDFAVKLTDVHPDGRSYNIAEGIIRCSRRFSLEYPEPVKPGEVMRLEIPLGATAYVFKRGHAVRVDVTSSMFPTFDRNPNRFMNSGEAGEQDFATAVQLVYHEERYPSHILLPVVQGRF